MSKGNMIKRKAYATQMTYEVSSNEKMQAEKALMGFDHLIKLLDRCDEHLNLIYTPFKNNPEVPSEETFKARASLRRFRDKVADNFNDFKKLAFKCFTMLQPFSSDTQTVKISKSFILCIGDIEKQVNRFIDLFSNLQSKEFGQTVVKAIENIKKEIAQLEQIIEDRIRNHLQNNILNRSWVDNVSDELQQKVEQKIPLSVELVNERQDKLNEYKDKKDSK